MVEMESEGKTVAEAVESALKKAGLRRDQVEVQVVQEGSAGFMGLGGKPARVKIVEKRWGPEGEQKSEPAPAPANGSSKKSARAHERAPRENVRRPAAVITAEVKEQTAPPDPKKACEASEASLGELLRMMGFAEAILTVSWDAEQERVKAVIQDPEIQRLIGKEGRTLEALQSLMTLMVGRKLGTPTAVQVDASGYWEKREKEILAQLQRGIERVKSTGKPFRLEPMDAVFRRLVHHSIANNPDVAASSEGEGLWRKIVLRPRN